MTIIFKKINPFKKYKKFALIALTIIIAMMIIFLSINGYVKVSVQDRIITPQASLGRDVDCILILGAGVRNGSPSPMLEDRLLEGIALYEAGSSNTLLMSGDHGQKGYDEVNTMKDFAMSKGVPSQDIFMDHAGFSTYESMYRARDVFQAEKIIIVTQGYHLYRALYIAKGLGIEAYGVPSDPREYVGQSYRDAREILGRIKDFFKVILQPPPTYLGEAIPVSGDGDLTND